MHELLAAYDRQVRRVSDFDGVERTDRVIRILLPHWRGVLWSDLDESDADQAIATEIDRFAGLGEFEWKYYSYDTPADLPDRLRAAGFVCRGDRDAADRRGRRPPANQSPPRRRRAARSPGRGRRRGDGRVNEEGFGEPAKDGFKRQVLKEIQAGRTRMVIAFAGDRPISMGRVEFYAGTEFGGLYGGATVPDWRGRGIFRAVVAQRTAWAAEQGYRYLQTDASDDSRPILERLGFIPVGTTTPFIHP